MFCDSGLCNIRMNYSGHLCSCHLKGGHLECVDLCCQCRCNITPQLGHLDKLYVFHFRYVFCMVQNRFDVKQHLTFLLSTSNTIILIYENLSTCNTIQSLTVSSSWHEHHTVISVVYFENVIDEC